jgi:TnpA family transposase
VPGQFLTDSQRTTYGRFTEEPSPTQLAHYFHLDDADRHRLAQYRSEYNRLGFALQLGTVRYLGTFVTDPMEVPHSVVRYVGTQIDVADPVACQHQYNNVDTQQRHAREIREIFGYHRFTDQPYHFALVRWLFARAWLTGERPSTLFEGSTLWLIERKVLLPGATTLERLVAQARHRANTRLWRLLAAAPDADQKTCLRRLLETDDTGFSKLDQLRRAPQRLSSHELVRALTRLADIRSLGVGQLDLGRIPPRRTRILARYASAARAQAIARMPDERRIATLTAFAREYEIVAQDDALDLFDMLLGKLLNESRKEGQKERLRTLRQLDRAAMTLARACEVLLNDGSEETDLRGAVFSQVPQDDLAAALETVGTLTRSPDDHYYDQLLSRYQTIRRFLPTFLEVLDFRSVDAARPVMRALAFLESIEGERRPLMDAAPLSVVTRHWRPLVVRPDEGIDRQAYSFCVLDRLRSALRRRDIYASPSHRWADPRAKLLQGPVWDSMRPAVCRDLGLPLGPEEQLSRLAQQLDDAYRRTARNLPDNTALRIESVDGRDEPVLTPLDKLEEPPSLIELRERVAALVPEVELPELLMEVDSWTGFTAEFTHLGEDNAWIESLPTSVCAVLMAEACNIGLEELSRKDVPALRWDRLRWVQQHYVRADTITSANARLVDKQSSIRLAEIWGGGEVASADGLRFAVPVRTINAGPNPKYFRGGRGVTYYNFVSDQYTGFHAVVIPGTLRDSLFILDGLLEHQTSLQPTELMSDSAGYSDVVFGLFWLLGYQFSPRLADLGELRFWRMDREADYGALGPVARHPIRPHLIADHWDDLLRIAGSLRLGTVRASELMRSLQRGGRVTTLAKAISELGRIAKTLYLLSYIDDESYRRRILNQINRGERRHVVARAVFFGQKGELRKKYREGQEDQLGALGLVVNMIVLWNTQYIQLALDDLLASGYPVLEEDVARMSPLIHNHVRMLGTYRFALPEPLAAGQFRPLKDPDRGA